MEKQKSPKGFVVVLPGELIKECAQRHQVIFLTCKEEYSDMLCGNEIRM